MASNRRFTRAYEKGWFALLFCIVTVTSSLAQNYTDLLNFDGTNGEHPLAPLVQGRDGNLYGTTSGDGVDIGGTVFKITTKGVVRTLHSFEGTDGFRPFAGLAQAVDGNFYGVTYDGGTSGNGAAFKITSVAS